MFEVGLNGFYDFCFIKHIRIVCVRAALFRFFVVGFLSVAMQVLDGGRPHIYIVVALVSPQEIVDGFVILAHDLVCGPSPPPPGSGLPPALPLLPQP